MSMKDERLEKVEEITINFETFKKALKRNYLGESDRWDRSYVLRLYPPFEAYMEAQYYESEQGRHYNREWDEKPYHITPELIIMENTDRGFRGIINWDEEYTIRSEFSDEEIEEGGGIEEFLDDSHEMFWDELKTILPETIRLEAPNLTKRYTVNVNWEFDDE